MFYILICLRIDKFALDKFQLIMNGGQLGEWVYDYICRNYKVGVIYDIEVNYIDLMDEIYLIALVDFSLKCHRERRW